MRKPVMTQDKAPLKWQEAEAILNSVQAMITLRDKDGIFLNVNSAAAKFIGAPIEEIIGKSLFDLFPTAIAQQMHERDLAVLRGKDMIINHIEEEEKRDGTKIWAKINKTPLLDGNNQPIGVVTHTEDVTEIFHAQHELEAKEHKLIAYANQLEASNQNLQEFAYVISHDLREPLRTITAYTQLLKRFLKPETLSQDTQDFMNFIVDAAKRMDGQINGILEYSRVGTVALTLEKTSLKEKVDVVKSMLKNQIDECGAIIAVTDEEDISVTADKMQLLMLLQNLISNALKYRKPDVPPHIKINAMFDRKHWHIQVSDNGIGIEPQYLESIFGVFRRLHTRNDIEGSGIGLSICRRIVQRHHGKIWATSTFGEGTTFHFTLPD